MFEITDEENQEISSLSSEYANASQSLDTKINNKFNPLLKLISHYTHCRHYDEQEKLVKETLDAEKELYTLKRSSSDYFGYHIGDFIMEDSGFNQNVFFILSKRLFGGYNVKKILSWMDCGEAFFVDHFDYNSLPRLEELFILLKEDTISRKKNDLNNIIEKTAMTDLMLDKIIF